MVKLGGLRFFTVFFEHALSNKFRVTWLLILGQSGSGQWIFSQKSGIGYLPTLGLLGQPS